MKKLFTIAAAVCLTLCLAGGVGAAGSGFADELKAAYSSGALRCDFLDNFSDFWDATFGSLFSSGSGYSSSGSSSTTDDTYDAHQYIFGPGTYEITAAVDGKGKDITNQVSGWLYLDKTARKSTPATFTLVFTYDGLTYTFTGKTSYYGKDGDDYIDFIGKAASGEEFIFDYDQTADYVVVSVSEDLYLGCEFKTGSENKAMPKGAITTELKGTYKLVAFETGGQYFTDLGSLSGTFAVTGTASASGSATFKLTLKQGSVTRSYSGTLSLICKDADDGDVYFIGEDKSGTHMWVTSNAKGDYICVQLNDNGDYAYFKKK